MFYTVEHGENMKTATIGARIPSDLKAALEQVAHLSGNSLSAIAESAFREHIYWRVPQLLDLQEAVAAADRGEFASEAEVSEFFKKYGC